jgi:hypothetical protein
MDGFGNVQMVTFMLSISDGYVHRGIGENCQYRHALPPGFVLDSQKKAKDAAAKANTITLDEFIEVEVWFTTSNIHLCANLFIQRHKLGPNLTPVTKESFAKWKQTRMNKKQAELQAIQDAKSTQAAAGKSSGMSGRDLVSPGYCLSCMVVSHCSSSHIIQNGSNSTKATKTAKKIGILANTDGKPQKVTRLKRMAIYHKPYTNGTAYISYLQLMHYFVTEIHSSSLAYWDNP